MLICLRIYIFWHQAFLNVPQLNMHSPNISLEGHQTAHICNEYFVLLSPDLCLKSKTLGEVTTYFHVSYISI